MFHAAKDLVSSRAAKTYVNNLIARYGKVEDLSIDSRNRRVRIVALLDGETSPVTIDVERYAVHAEGAKRFIEVEQCRCSRRWVESLLLDYVRGRRFPLPSWAASVL
ncbi:hypothetical protein DB347_02885 [Opitutaceae bacterium EW11]|nr:hypothetical protein DB347_02885 [Opitutaceae bacterium EW11]